MLMSPKVFEDLKFTFQQMAGIGKRLREAQKPNPRSLIGKFVLDIQCDGCMGEDHQLKRVGEIIGVSPYREIWPHEGDRYEDRFNYAICRTIQSREDLPQELFYVCIEAGGFQPIPSGRGFFYRR